MLYYGRHITKAGDNLHPIEPEALMTAIRNPKPHLQDAISQLRALRSLDPARYRDEKKNLPYFVCARFHPSVRRKECFASIAYLVLDLDHLADHVEDPAALKKNLQADHRVLGYFDSPGGDGLKILFRLHSPCTDSSLFSAFYKLFARDVARTYNILSCLDGATHDVTRACFLSHDPDAWYNPAAVPLQIEDLIPALDFDPVATEIKDAEKELKAAATTPTPTTPDKDALAKIKSRLNPSAKIPRKKDYFVPDEVEHAMEKLRQRLPDFDLMLKSADPISYGRKLHVLAQGTLLFAEINLFYGKRGFSLVLTMKSGSSQELGTVACEVIAQILQEEKLSA
jgi:hypothetical protein